MQHLISKPQQRRQSRTSNVGVTSTSSPGGTAGVQTIRSSRSGERLAPESASWFSSARASPRLVIVAVTSTAYGGIPSSAERSVVSRTFDQVHG
jgi:hypothetical protein